jgi:hypothetical protein
MDGRKLINLTVFFIIIPITLILHDNVKAKGGELNYSGKSEQTKRNISFLLTSTPYLVPEITPTPSKAEEISGKNSTSTQQAVGEKCQIDTNNLRSLIPSKDDLPAEAMYRVCPDCESRITNEELVWAWGGTKANEYTNATGRVTGWGIKYTRGTLEYYAPLYLTLEVHAFDSVEGAFLAVSQYNPAYLFPDDNWVIKSKVLDQSNNRISIIKSKFDRGGTETVEFLEAFSMCNLVGIIKAEGWPEDIVVAILDDATNKLYANIQKLDRSDITVTHIP